MRKIKREGATFERLANDLARGYAPDIYACKKCSYPVMQGYCCGFCGSATPSTTKEQDKEFEKLCASKRRA